MILLNIIDNEEVIKEMRDLEKFN